MVKEEMTVAKFIEEYIAGLKSSLNHLLVKDLVQVTHILYQAYINGKQVFIMGNGGSAAIASHFACDLGKGTAVTGKPRFRVMSLNDNMALVTALSNDLGYESVFKEQLVNLVNEGDVVVVISSSGSSENLVRAVEYANCRGAATVGLLGFGGGRLKELVDYQITLPSRNYGHVESIHQFVEHLIVEYFMERLKNER